MKLALIGVNHRTAPVELRERLAFRTEEIPQALLEAHAQGAKEAIILSTCNRVEIAATVESGMSCENLLHSILTTKDSVALADLLPHLYVFEEKEAIRHLFRVAASLDSMIVGEPQILGQLKQAYTVAREHGMIGPHLDAVLTKAFSVAKRIRTETEIGQSAVSVSYAAVELAKEIFGSLSRRTVLVLGAGKMSEGAARHLIRAGADKIFITNRTPERAHEMARVFRGEALPYEVFPQRLADMDIVITSSAAPGYILTIEMVRRAIEVRKHQPVFLIDIAVPRNVDPAVNEVEHAYLYDIDDLQRIADRNLKLRGEVAQQAESIVVEEVARLESKLRERDVVPTILGLQEQLDSIRKEVLARYRVRLGPMTPEQEEALDAMTRAMINRIAHGPISELRRQAANRDDIDTGRDSELVSAVRRIFRLT